MNTTSRYLLPLALCAVLAPLTTHAGEPGFYVGGFYAKTSKEDADDSLNNIVLGFYEQVLDYTPITRDTRFDREDTAWGFLAGYQLFTNLAFEGGYLSLTKDVLRENTSGTFLVQDTPESWTTSFGVRSSGFALSALGTLPISYDWELFARGGVYLASNSLTYYVVNQDGLGGADELSESSADLLAGVGISMRLAEVYQLRAEVMRVFDAGADDYGETDVDVLSIGITVRF